MAPYVYQRLTAPESDGAEFRFVTLHHGVTTDAIEVSIDIHSLSADHEHQPISPEEVSWEALSYTWGELSAVEDILVVEQESGRPVGELSVTKSLAQALRHMRYTDIDRLMWIDAICIDQASNDIALEERMWQVRNMHHIYSQANGVVIWLGPEADDSSYALQQLDDLGSSITIDWLEYQFITADGEPCRSMQMWKSSSYTSREQRAIRHLLDRPYFDRVWVKQEALLANDIGSLVYAGKQSISLESFRNAIFFLTMVVGVDIHSPNLMHETDRLLAAASLCVRTYLEPIKLMDRTRRCKCSDPRDKVYGNLGIMAFNDRIDLCNRITIDYSDRNNVEMTYLDFFIQYSKLYGSLELLMDSGLARSDMRPTWVPDWRVVNSGKFSVDTLSATSHFRAPKCQFYSEGLLQVIGRYATTISHVRILESDTNLEIKQSWYEELAMLMKDHLHPLRVREGVEMVSQAIANHIYNPELSHEDTQQIYVAIKTYFKALYFVVTEANWRLCDGVPPPSDYMDDGASAALGTCIRWFKIYEAPFIFSSDGRVGMGPPGVQIGDRIYAILGCRSLMVLRATQHGSTSESRYQVVAPCFMHGLNRGETLLGPLPDGCTVVPRFQTSIQSYVSYYVGVRADTESMWDPRIAWEELDAPLDMVNAVLVDTPPGEPTRLRPGIEYLKRHGIDMETLLLE